MKLPATLFNTEQGFLSYTIKALGLSLGGALLISIAVGLLLPQVEGPEFNLEVPLWAMFFGIVIFSPVLETLIMWPIIALLGKVTKNTLATTLISAAIWAILHSLQAAAWGLVIFWSFVVFSTAFIEWRKRSVGSALGVTMLIHGAQNLCAFSLILAGLYFSDSGNFNNSASVAAETASGFTTNIIRSDGSTLVTTGNGNSSIRLPEPELILEGRKLTLNGSVITLPNDDVVLDFSTPGDYRLNGMPLPAE